MKVYVLVFAFPYEGLEVDNVFLLREDAEKARLAKRPRKFWEVDEMELEIPKKWITQFNQLAQQANEERQWTGTTSKKKRSSKPSS